MIEYGYVKTINKPFEDICRILPEEVQKEGFGILTKIDIKDKLKEKLGVDFPRYTIFGACNPPSAFKALSAEINIGLFLPCNIAVYEKEGKTILSVIKPTIAMNSVNNDALLPIAREIEDKLKRIFDSIE